ncbi:hypothetical protein M514_07651 [Trichuris suis]|uniref:SPIN90/Ldb17 leucine-rich domain-containing protein n=1 Tax=Trichuris suis TaxID=68888 RepID=A0A085N8G9_9BILA|nr:hypothetical protein M513_07651 [Trichuris suis]KFD65765.1 hypothetical protein M514_07651 [Trichuris suis]KHJ43644.1 hypothetical protein D918_06149 [Trichuris suis]
MSQFPYKRAPADYSKVAREMIDSLRARFDFPYEECKECVIMVVDAARVALGIDQLEPFYEVLTKVTVDTENCVDFSRFSKCLGDLSDAVLDGQQRSWSLYDDEEEILSNLTTLRSLTLKADAEVSRKALSENEFMHIRHLILLYQMETRSSIRAALLDFFQIASKLGTQIIAYLVNSSLPPQVASDLISLNGHVEKVEAHLKLLAAIFSTGEAVPFDHYGVLNDRFVDFLIRIFIDQEQTPIGIADLALAVIVAFNLHFPPDYHDNIVVKCLSNHESRLLFMERLMIYFNCRDNPIGRCTDAKWSNSLCIVKLLDDIVQCSNLTELCFKGDLQLFSEIICREVTDIEPDERRTAYLKLLAHSILQLKDTPEICKLINDTFKIFACGNEANASEDKALVEFIRNAVATSCTLDK